MLPNDVFRWGKSHAKNSGGPGPSSMDNPPPEMTPAGTRPPADVSSGHNLKQRGKGIFHLLLSDWQQLLRAGAAPGPRRSVPVAAKRAADPRGGRAALPQPGPEQDGGADGSPPARAAAVRPTRIQHVNYNTIWIC